MRAQARAFLAALGFLTRLRVSGNCPREEDFTCSVTYFPLVGLTLAGLLYFLWWGLLAGLPLPAQAGLLLAAEIYLTGGLHLDGFIDTCDGLFSGRGRERILEIMKDSHVGAHGVTAAITLLILKFSLVLSLLQSIGTMSGGGAGPMFGAGLAPPLILMMVLARWAMVVALSCFPYARPQGLGALFGAGRIRRPLVLASVLTLVIAWLCGSWPGLVVMVAAALLTLWWGRWVCSLIGGLTGDTYGALAELTEVWVLLLLVVAG